MDILLRILAFSAMMGAVAAVLAAINAIFLFGGEPRVSYAHAFRLALPAWLVTWVMLILVRAFVSYSLSGIASLVVMGLGVWAALRSVRAGRSRLASS